MLAARSLVAPIVALLLGAQPETRGPFVQNALAIPGTRWVRATTPSARLYALRGTAAERSLATLGVAVEAALASNLQALGATSAPVVDVLFVGSREQMRPFTGGTPGGWAEPRERAAILVADGTTQPALRHELMHLLSWQLWGTPGGVWLSEGVATAAVGRCHGTELHAIAAALVRDGRDVPVATLRRQFVVAGEAGLAHYVEAGSLVRHIEQTYGRDGLRRLWQSGLAGIETSLRVTVSELEAGWRARLARTAPAPAAIYAQIRRDGCE